ncbi:carbohydrate sulfotransferase 4-like [Tubulanus polymorphus]|uniref:carbohydrate sulfotransferase 4-like n=1 Tax=Tubulanus polymorphus TaxID=672921 RepID=UPI003DA6CA91
MARYFSGKRPWTFVACAVTVVVIYSLLKPPPELERYIAVNRPVVYGGKTTNGDTVIKVLLIAHGRGGSSLLGRLFDTNPDAFYFYEPDLRMFPGYGTRPLATFFTKDGSKRYPFDSPSRVKELIDNLNSLGNCNFSATPPPTRNHEFFWKSVKGEQFQKKCLSSPKYTKQQCIDMYEQECHNSSVRALKVLHFDIDFALKLVKIDPSWRVIRYVRDPRGIVRSRFDDNNPNVQDWMAFKDSILGEGELLCRKMLENAQKYPKLKQMYPKNIQRFSYEQIATNPISQSEAIYRFLGLELPESVKSAIKKSTSDSQLFAEETFSVKRKNGTETAYKWMKTLKTSDLQALDKLCGPVLDLLGYPRFENIHIPEH